MRYKASIHKKQNYPNGICAVSLFVSQEVSNLKVGYNNEYR